jgi:hypothetical protein
VARRCKAVDGGRRHYRLIAMPSRRSRPGPEVRAARLDEAAALSALCVRSKAVWGYDGAFMTLAHNALQVSSAQIAAGDV